MKLNFKNMKFLNSDSKFSMRKFLAFAVGLSWVAAHAVWLSVNSESELPLSYIGVDSGVILFYFGKEVISKLKLTSKDDPKKE